MNLDQSSVHYPVLQEFDEHLANAVGAAGKTREMYLRYSEAFLREYVGEKTPLGSVKWDLLKVASYVADLHGIQERSKLELLHLVPIEIRIVETNRGRALRSDWTVRK